MKAHWTVYVIVFLYECNIPYDCFFEKQGVLWLSLIFMRKFQKCVKYIRQMLTKEQKLHNRFIITTIFFNFFFNFRILFFCITRCATALAVSHFCYARTRFCLRIARLVSLYFSWAIKQIPARKNFKKKETKNI